MGCLQKPVVPAGGGSFGTAAEIVLLPQSGEGVALLANNACARTEDELKAMAMSVHKRPAR